MQQSFKLAEQGGFGLRRVNIFTVNFSNIKVITHMRHRIIVSFRNYTHLTASLQAGL